MARRNLRRLCATALAVWLACTLCVVYLALVWPDAPGDKRAKKSGAVVDYSHASDGYVMVKYKESKKKLKLRLIKDDVTYTYDLNGDGAFEVFPLQMGSGDYNARVFKQVSGTNYAQAASLKFDVSLSDEFAPFLCPNQYVWYEPNDAIVAQSNALCASLGSDRAKVDAVHDYLRKNFTYDYVRALTVTSGYLPDLPKTLDAKMGICFDLAAMLAAMLRVQGIPARLVIGHADRAYHAWNDVYVDGAYERIDVTSELTGGQAGTYAEERVY